MRLDEITRRDFIKGAAGAAATTMLPVKKAEASAQWIDFGHAQDGSTVYFDNKSLKYDESKDQYTVWFKFEGGKSPGTYKLRVSPSGWQSATTDGIWGRFQDTAPDSIPDLFLDYMKYMKKRNYHLDDEGVMRPNKP
jgi:hypothetical protein